eukprot:scaffold7120_cov49-Cyclotella_meneghiniana.AAC.4
MKLSIALVSLLSTVHANKLRGINDNNNNDDEKVAKIQLNRGNNSNRGIIQLTPEMHHALQTTNDAEDFAACSAHKSSNDCSNNSNDSCTWCESKAVSSACYPSDKVGKLPAGVFECANASVTVEAVQDEGATVKEENAKSVKKAETFNLKSGITLTLSSDAVDNEFCDPNSASLAGYMNGTW